METRSCTEGHCPGRLKSDQIIFIFVWVLPRVQGRGHWSWGTDPFDTELESFFVPITVIVFDS